MKKILTSVLAAVLSVTAAVPFVSDAEYQKLSSDDELMAEMRKSVQEYMESKGRTKLSKEAANVCHWPYLLGDCSDIMEMYIGDYANNDIFDYYDVHYEVDDRVLNISLNDGITHYEVSDYLSENFAGRIGSVYFPRYRGGFNNFIPDDSEIDVCVRMNNDSDMKVIANALKEAGYADSCYAQFGTVSWNEDTYSVAPLSTFQPTSMYSLPDADKNSELYTTVEDVFELIAGGTIDADFGLIVEKEFVKEGFEYKEIDYPNVIDPWSEYACIPLTEETDYTSFDKDIIDNIYGFTAVPHEDSLESQSELLAEIYDNVPIFAARRSTMQNASVCEGIGYVFDAINTVNGDANCDGEYTIADSTAILQSLGNPDKYGLSFQGRYNADIHNVGDGITPSDALEVQKAMASNSNLNS